MNNLEFKLPNIDIQWYLSQEQDPAKRIAIIKWQLLNKLFDQFEEVERREYHEAESEKIVLDILGDIAKAKVEKKKEVMSRETFYPSEITFEMWGKEDDWKPRLVTKKNLSELVLSKSTSEYYNIFNSPERILGERKQGVLHMVITKLLKRKKGLTLAIGRKYIGSGHLGGYEPVLLITW